MRFLSYKSDMSYFVDVIDETFFDALLTTMIDSDGTYSKVMRLIGSYPHIKDRLLKLLEEEIAWLEDDLK